MCRQVITDKQVNGELEFIIYNIVFGKNSGRFTMDDVRQQLLEINIRTQESLLECLFNKWIDNGLIFNNAVNYVINKSYY